MLEVELIVLIFFDFFSVFLYTFFLTKVAIP